MKKHIKNYLASSHYDACDVDIIKCEIGCPNVAVDIHHIVYKSQGGKDKAENLIALCRVHHEAAHNKKIKQRLMLEIAKRRCGDG